MSKRRFYGGTAGDRCFIEYADFHPFYEAKIHWAQSVPMDALQSETWIESDIPTILMMSGYHSDADIDRFAIRDDQGNELPVSREEKIRQIVKPFLGTPKVSTRDQLAVRLVMQAAAMTEKPWFDACNYLGTIYAQMVNSANNPLDNGAVTNEEWKSHIDGATTQAMRNGRGGGSLTPVADVPDCPRDWCDHVDCPSCPVHSQRHKTNSQDPQLIAENSPATDFDQYLTKKMKEMVEVVL